MYKDILNSSSNDQIDYIMGAASEREREGGGEGSNWCGCPRQQR